MVSYQAIVKFLLKDGRVCGLRTKNSLKPLWQFSLKITNSVANFESKIQKCGSICLM